MPNNIERLNYYEREHLRSFDFTAEQNYHLEMRRRLNIALHLWGIVDGLDVRKGNIVPGAPDQFYITEGMAIDAYGREIVLFAPYVLSADDLGTNRVGPGKYSLWIAYDRNPSTPPSAGYGLCDIKDQYTRWTESFKILLKPENYANGTEPRVFDALDDDPEKAKWLVRLGTLEAKKVNNELTVFDAKPEQRTYVGLRAQRVVASVANLTPGSTEAKLPITVEADLQEKKNLTVGSGFDIDPDKVTPPPVPPKFPNKADFPGPAGNIKANNLFLLDNLYASVGGQWLGLKEYLKTLIPDIQVNPISMPITPTADSPSNGTVEFNLTSTLPECSDAKMMVALAGIEMQNTAALTLWWKKVLGADAPVVQVSAAAATRIGVTKNQFKFGINWTVGPKDARIPVTNQILSIKSILVDYIVVFYP